MNFAEPLSIRIRPNVFSLILFFLYLIIIKINIIKNMIDSTNWTGNSCIPFISSKEYLYTTLPILLYSIPWQQPTKKHPIFPIAYINGNYGKQIYNNSLKVFFNWNLAKNKYNKAPITAPKALKPTVINLISPLYDG